MRPVRQPTSPAEPPAPPEVPLVAPPIPPKAVVHRVEVGPVAAAAAAE